MSTEFIVKIGEKKTSPVNARVDNDKYQKFSELKTRMYQKGYDVSINKIVESAFDKAIKEAEEWLEKNKALPDVKAPRKKKVAKNKVKPLPESETKSGLAKVLGDKPQS